jgi:hypothetical protein
LYSNENNSNVVEPEAKYCCIPEKPNLKSAKTVKPYVAWIWGGLAGVSNRRLNQKKTRAPGTHYTPLCRACARRYPAAMSPLPFLPHTQDVSPPLATALRFSNAHHQFCPIHDVTKDFARDDGAVAVRGAGLGQQSSRHPTAGLVFVAAISMPHSMQRFRF